MEPTSATHKGFKSTTGMIAGIVVVVLVIAGANWIIKNKPLSQVSSTPSTSDVDMKGWQTYRNEEFGFEMKLISEWKVNGITANEKYDGVYNVALSNGTDAFSFNIFPIALWKSWDDGRNIPVEDFIGAGGIYGEIASNNKYAFGIHSRATYGFQKENSFKEYDAMMITFKAFDIP